MSLRRNAKLAVALLVFASAARLAAATPPAQQSPARTAAAIEAAPATALSEALTAACRQNGEQFARYLTVENAAVFRGFTPATRAALMKRFVLLDDPGRPLLSSDPQGHPVLRCEAPGVTAEMRFGDTRLRENLAFVPVDVVDARQVEFGLVREGGAWKLLSVGLLLLDLSKLERQWEQADVEAREAAAIAALRRLAEALGTYRQEYGRLPEKLAQLGPAAKQGASADAAGLVDAEFADGRKGGYLFRYRILPSSGIGAAAEFELAATPAEYGKAGRRSFFLDSSGTLRGADKQGAVATILDPRIEPR